ncbi:hypothetical protein GCM10010226_87380 [Streptomyces phaeofaciens]|uniref:Uncharacterized protein n=2 Tax=Streptomyces phaeofaciens TaxID=68254 RepID=A0A918M1U1_9ACTN|nr:hypothetical protein GCM10010226_87380 [Streptomyces phaeofaciens]
MSTGMAHLMRPSTVSIRLTYRAISATRSRMLPAARVSPSNTVHLPPPRLLGDLLDGAAREPLPHVTALRLGPLGDELIEEQLLLHGRQQVAFRALFVVGEDLRQLGERQHQRAFLVGLCVGAGLKPTWSAARLEPR